MNPRVSRSSALASKATGFPIAKIAARLAVGYTLDEISNDITRATPACFEPVIDYVVTKVPRWAFEKLPGTTGVLGTQMQSVGEVMAIGRTFPESIQKALRSLEHGRAGLNCDPAEAELEHASDGELLAAIAVPTPNRIFEIGELLRRGRTIEELHEACRIDPWFLDQLLAIVEHRHELATVDGPDELDARAWRRAKRLGFSDAQLAHLWAHDRDPRAGAPRARRCPPHVQDGRHVRRRVRRRDAVPLLDLGGRERGPSLGPAASRHPRLRSEPHRSGHRVRLLLRPCQLRPARRRLRDRDGQLQPGDGVHRLRHVRPPLLRASHRRGRPPRDRRRDGSRSGTPPQVIVTLGGQTPLKLASLLPEALVAGTPPASIDLAEDREKWNAVCDELRIPQPPGGMATDLEEALAVVEQVGFPVLVRPSYVLGGRAMQIVHDVNQLASAMAELAGFGSLAREGGLSAERPVLIDRFLEDAVEVDVDAVRDVSGEVLIGGVMEHVEEAGVHSGDSACAIPPQTLPSWVVEVIEAYTTAIADRLDVRGCINVQYAVTGTTVYVIEANPRASRTVPFVAKATGVPLAKVATRVMLGATLAELRVEGLLPTSVLHGAEATRSVAVKEAVLPFSRFPEVDPALGPEMRSTGEVMGIDRTFGLAFYKAELAAGTVLPTAGTVFLSLADGDKPAGLVVAKRLRELDLGVVATQGTADYLARFGQSVDEVVAKVSEGAGKTAVDLIGDGAVVFVVNTPEGRGGRSDGELIRKACTLHRVACVTTVDAALAAVHGLAEQRAPPHRGSVPAGTPRPRFRCTTRGCAAS